MNKADLKILERIYADEIDSALSGRPYVSQIRGKRVEELATMGYVKRVTERLGGRFPVTISGYQLTLMGNAAYCMSCADD